MSLPVHHVGLTVSDLERTAQFYELFGGKEISADHFCGPQFDRGLGVDGADFDTKMIQVGALLIELLSYHEPTRKPYTSRNCDIGAPHVAFQVDDIFAAYERVTATGVESYSPPQMVTEGAFADGYFVYLKDPDGMSVELIQTP
ncbi:VOC family protein [Jatrophihabitans lederbergiae]|uniref:VOC family protein n=1 Tax=Jatrophihabitans lederbergiae TaxID=3075547 RepID=A0ABU2JG37_9ACTN|nr:VOC family protein [Jatrophihabitans sp. DSM 44399]MDT0263971.1 VOC family protein [Jatrophihabitans sp. DSM 44399]